MRQGFRHVDRIPTADTIIDGLFLSSWSDVLLFLFAFVVDVTQLRDLFLALGAGVLDLSDPLGDASMTVFVFTAVK